jgi:poly(3-hydroxyalkanoate) synthetase
MVSWKNPTAVDRDLGMDDYVQLGFKEALRVVNEIVPERRVHTVGYCIGGTLLSMGAALLGGARDERLASVTLLAALTDFSEPGELSVFISPSQLSMLEAVMHRAGFLLKSIRVPMFVVGTETDHVAPWRAVYKTRELTRSPDYTFVLTNGGHNAGIATGPVHPKRRYRILTWPNDTDMRTPEDWLTTAPSNQGSWWPEWQHWLASRSDPQRQPARPVVGPQGTPESVLEEAPGRYVRE